MFQSWWSLDVNTWPFYSHFCQFVLMFISFFTILLQIPVQYKSYFNGINYKYKPTIYTHIIGKLFWGRLEKMSDTIVNRLFEIPYHRISVNKYDWVKKSIIPIPRKGGGWSQYIPEWNSITPIPRGGGGGGQYIPEWNSITPIPGRWIGLYMYTILKVS